MSIISQEEGERIVEWCKRQPWGIGAIFYDGSIQGLFDFSNNEYVSFKSVDEFRDWSANRFR
tara:strand:- start:32081 stop:32266 length:186 start_codon:yes stop_codon:yes gene_type:complete